MELDWACSGLSLEIRGDASKTQVRVGHCVVDKPGVVVEGIDKGFPQSPTWFLSRSGLS